MHRKENLVSVLTTTTATRSAGLMATTYATCQAAVPESWEARPLMQHSCGIGCRTTSKPNYGALWCLEFTATGPKYRCNMPGGCDQDLGRLSFDAEQFKDWKKKKERAGYGARCAHRKQQSTPRARSRGSEALQAVATMPGAMFVWTLVPFWDHVGSILEVSGTLRYHSGVSGCQG